MLCVIKFFKDCKLTVPQHNHITIPNNKCTRELSYSILSFKDYVSENEIRLVNDQQKVYSQVLHVSSTIREKHFLLTHLVIGKTFLINWILAKIILQQKIAIAVPSSGIAATLMSGGKTTHCVFNLPLNLNYSGAPFCNINKGTPVAQLLKQWAIIIWDECTMSHKWKDRSF